MNAGIALFSYGMRQKSNFFHLVLCGFKLNPMATIGSDQTPAVTQELPHAPKSQAQHGEIDGGGL